MHPKHCHMLDVWKQEVGPKCGTPESRCELKQLYCSILIIHLLKKLGNSKEYTEHTNRQKVNGDMTDFTVRQKMKEHGEETKWKDNMHTNRLNARELTQD